MNKKTILIAEDDRELGELLAARCRRLGLEAIAVRTATDALSVVECHRPDLVCLDVNMPAGNGLSVCEMMASDDRWSEIPVIILTGRTDPETVLRCHRLCAYYVLKCPDVWSRVEPLLYELLELEPCPEEPNEALPMTIPMRRKPSASTTPVASNLMSAASDPMSVDTIFELLGAAPNLFDPSAFKADESRTNEAVEDTEDAVPWVLHIEDDADLSDSLKTRLESHGIAVVRAFNGMEGYRTAFTRPADAIILDVEMPNGQGDYILRRLKENPVTGSIPVIILTGRKDRALERKMMNLGAEKYLTKPLEFRDLLTELRRHIDVLQTPAPC